MREPGRGSSSGTRLARSQALRTYFAFLELRHQVELHAMTGRVVTCPVDEMNRPRGSKDAKLRIPPTAAELGVLFTGWAAELASCRKFAPAARNYTAARLLADCGLRVSETRLLDLPDIKWELGPFGKLHALRGGLTTAVATHLPQWTGKVTPHVLRHFCASQLYLDGVDLISIQETLGHAWVATTMRSARDVHRTRIEEAWLAGQQRAAQRLQGVG